VLETGDVGAGDQVEIVFRPDHGITVETAFRIAMTEKSRLPELAPAVRYLPLRAQPKMAAKIAARSAAAS
jgi:MOSC domain-containing protein YiiM